MSGPNGRPTGASAPPQTSPDGRWWWDGERWASWWDGQRWVAIERPAGTGRQSIVDRPSFKTVAALAALTVSLMAIGGGAFAGLSWWLSPNYKTEYLVDTSASGGESPGSDVQAIESSVSASVAAVSDTDSLALRRFGGQCGDSDSTARLVSFARGNASQIRDSVSRLHIGGKATLEKGMVAAIDDFGAGLTNPPAKQLSRIVVITSHSGDACDTDGSNVADHIRDRLAASRVSFELRFVGYRLSPTARDFLTQMARALDSTTVTSKAPDFPTTPADLTTAVNRAAVPPGATVPPPTAPPVTPTPSMTPTPEATRGPTPSLPTPASVVVTWRSGCINDRALEFSCPHAGDYVVVRFDVPQSARHVGLTWLEGAEYLLDDTLIGSGRTACEQGATRALDAQVKPGPHTLTMIAIDVSPPGGTTCGFEVGITALTLER